MISELALPKASLSSLDQEILKAAKSFVGVLESKQYSVQPTSLESIEKLLSLDITKKEQIHFHLKTLGHLSMQEPESNPESTEYPEKKLVEQALRFFKLRLKSQDFWESVAYSDVVEIYDENGYQIFRSFNFFNTSGYSLMDILTNEWYVLWERPKFILNTMLRYANDVLGGKLEGVTKMELPPHVVKEIYSGTDAADFVPRSLLVQFKSVCPLHNDKGEVAGFILNSSVNLHTMGDEETRRVMVL